MRTAEQVDWANVPGVEIKPKVQSGAPVFAGTRVPVNVVTNNVKRGGTAEEIEGVLDNFDVTREQIDLVLRELRRPVSPKHRTLAG